MEGLKIKKRKPKCREVAQKICPRSTKGQGRYGVFTTCWTEAEVTVYKTLEDARKHKKFIDDFECSQEIACTGNHIILDLKYCEI